MSLVPNRAIEGAAGNQGYNIQRSLRFRSSASAYLNRTQTGTVTNNNLWTFSCWVKRGAIATTTSLLSAYTGTGASQIYFTSSDNLRVYIPDNGGSTKLDYITTQVFRDPSAWYHVCISLDNTLSTAVLTVSVNGAAVTSFSTSTNTLVQNGNYQINHASSGMLAGEIYSNGTSGSLAAGYYFDGYLAEVNFIDGQALTPSSFGQTDSTTGAWIPKRYGGSYGTNGFYLPFTNTTSATTLAYDSSGNGNNWTPNNISTTAGATYDSMTDVPTLTSATAANYCTWNPLYYWHDTYFDPCTLTNGNLTASDSGKPWNTIAYGTFGMASGKWYWEITNTTLSDWHKLGIIAADYTQAAPFDNAYTYNSNGTKQVLATNSSYGATFATGDIIGLAFDADTGTLTCYKNGVSQGTLSSAIPMTKAYVPYYQSNDAGTNVVDANFGQRMFSYTPPTGFKALNTFNLPDPTIKKPNQYMDATLWTGSTSGTVVVNSGGFQPDMVWYKSRSNVENHQLFDSIRGAPNSLYPNLTNSATNDPGVTSFNSNGFTVNNPNGYTYVGWQWKESATAGFDIVTYTGDGTNRNISHNLGVAPSMIIVKSRNATNGWYVCHVGSWGGDGNGLFLNNTASTYNRVSDLGGTGITAMTSSYFTATTGSGTFLNTSGTTYVAYVFAAIPGMSAFGSYTGNGSTDGPFVYCGFRPKYIMVKQTSASGEDWIVQDTARAPYNNGSTSISLFPDSSSAEVNTAAQLWDVTSNGFKIRASGGGVNTNGATYIYAAFAENPFKYSNAR